MAKVPVKIFSGRATRDLANRIAAAYGKPLGEVIVTPFADGEFQVSFEETIRGTDLFIVQSTTAPFDNLMELLLLTDAAKRASASRIVAIIPYYGLARQDRKDKPRVAIGAKLVADLLSKAGVDRIITMDLHSDQIQGFFDVPVDHLYGSTIFVPYLKSLELDNLVIASPDVGGAKRANSYAKFLNSGLAICHKQRTKPNEVSSMTIIGDVKDKNVVIVDDIIDTAGSITKAAGLIMDNGAKSVRAICTHPVFSGPAIERIENSAFEEVFVLDTIEVKRPSDKIKVLRCAELIADVIHRVNKGKSISGHFDFSTIG